MPYLKRVFGLPKPEGRPRAVIRGRRAGIRPSDVADTWKDAVAREFRGVETLEGTLDLMVIFIMPRPKNHFGSGRNAGKLLPSAPKTYCQTKPDIDNLLKSTMDAMTDEGVWRDDSQVVKIAVEKKYAQVHEASATGLTVQVEKPGAVIIVGPIANSFTRQRTPRKKAKRA